jgi:hypothetical protein
MGSKFMVAVRKHSDRVPADSDLLPVRAVRNRETRHRATTTRRQVNDAAREPRRCYPCRNGGRNIGEGRNLNLFAGAKLFKTARKFFAHNDQRLCVTATMRTFLFSQTRVQFDAVSSSAFVGESPATEADVNFTPRGCST